MAPIAEPPPETMRPKAVLTSALDGATLANVVPNVAGGMELFHFFPI